MGIEKFRRPLLVIDTEVPPEGGFGGGSGDGVVTADPDTMAMRGADGSLRAATGSEDDSVVNEIRLNEVQNDLNSYINDLVDGLSARITALENAANG